ERERARGAGHAADARAVAEQGRPRRRRASLRRAAAAALLAQLRRAVSRRRGRVFPPGQRHPGAGVSSTRLRPAILTLQAIIVIALVGFVFDLQDHLRWSLYSEQFLALVLGACLGLAYLTPPQEKERVPWWDVAAAAIGFVSCLYVGIDYPSLSQLLADRPPAGVALSIVIIVLVLEGTRRTSGPSLVWVVLGFVAYALLGHFLPEPFTSRPVDVTR